MSVDLRMKVENGLVYLQNILDPLDWALIFPQAQPVVLDLGAGDGGFASQYAERHPERNVLAVERLLGRVRKIAKKSVRLNLPNLRVVRIESAYLLEFLVPSASLLEVHLLFADPWPKKKHQDRRLIQPKFLATLAQALRPGGFFRFTTDHAEYFQSATPLIDASPELVRIVSPEEYPQTDFEREFRAQGLTIHDQVWQRK